MITPRQLSALQSLCGQVFGGEADLRAARLEWASAQLGRPVASFRDLSITDAATLIGQLKRGVGQPDEPPRRRPRNGRAAGTHGRRNVAVTVPVIAGPDDLARVERARIAAGMSVEGLASWLSSKSSPIGPRSDGRIRTLADANKIYWALKSMARRAG